MAHLAGSKGGALTTGGAVSGVPTSAAATADCGADTAADHTGQPEPWRTALADLGWPSSTLAIVAVVRQKHGPGVLGRLYPGVLAVLRAGPGHKRAGDAVAVLETVAQEEAGTLADVTADKTAAPPRSASGEWCADAAARDVEAINARLAVQGWCETDDELFARQAAAADEIDAAYLARDAAAFRAAVETFGVVMNLDPDSVKRVDVDEAMGRRVVVWADEYDGIERYTLPAVTREERREEKRADAPTATTATNKGGAPSAAAAATPRLF